MYMLAASGSRTPDNDCCRCFLSDLTELAVMPPPGSLVEYLLYAERARVSNQKLRRHFPDVNGKTV